MIQMTRTNGNTSWYTPKVYIEAARQVLGQIDLDPASCAEANKIVQAKRYFTIDDDGLTKPWTGKVWLNPPYARGVISHFIRKLISSDCEYLCLVNSALDTAWAADLITDADAVCLVRGRIRFIKPGGERAGAPPIGQMIAYGGPNDHDFETAFRQFGIIIEKR